ncbi:MAG: hypothetical protein COV72_02790 [Candidatus Omnitrophica bacterium CG11_big_fil_rev_8_21_14_0_20_42_13]|uniref:histidine kinase n=1 Tax=Candidatus Ghiorseimicrobium undicola TaxID=1974746 RepID=A0A2H0LYD5_9BACT|nr:MAG: hypothetical protein COV72_02790 [Candidatus Omnitrophica bacterium CG11_big_fil_rev_8_21_14_0_20_42_13]
MLTSLNHNKEKIKELSRLLKTINSSANTKDLFRASLNQILLFLGAERGSVLLFDIKNNNLILRLMRGQEENFNDFKDAVQKIGEGISGTVALEKKPILVKNIRTDSRFKNTYNILNHYKTNSFLSVPLFIKDTLIGVINITDKTSKNVFLEEELEYLTIISTQISYTYERIKLQDEINIKTAENAKLAVEKIEIERQLNIAKKFASLGKISSSIAHEINNPLDGVMRYTNLCLDRIDRNEKNIKDYLIEVKDGLKRIANTVRSLLEFSRHNTPSNKLISINETLNDAVSGVIKKYGDCSFTLIKNYALAQCYVYDKGIKHVFVNILKNACEAMEDKKEGRLSIETCEGENTIDIKISDSGYGIKDENRTTIFEPFFTTKSAEKGAGLGLAICYDIVQKYNGSIKLDSKPSDGTTFTISIPRNETLYDNKEANIASCRT